MTVIPVVIAYHCRPRECVTVYCKPYHHLIVFQNWIRRKNMKRRAAIEAEVHHASLPSIKRKKTTAWHEHLKEFAKSEGSVIYKVLIMKLI